MKLSGGIMDGILAVFLVVGSLVTIIILTLNWIAKGDPRFKNHDE